MERQSPADMQAVKTIDAHTYTTPTTVTMATTSCSNSTVCTQAPLGSLSILPSDQQAVRVIQQTIHRPQSMAAQYLHHMYAAQQQHLMLQTAALQQSQYQHKPQLQSLTSIPQAPTSQRQLSSPSSMDSMVPPAGGSQTSITLPASSVTAHLIGRSQTSSSTAAATVSQQAMLLGNRPNNCNQAQMYLRTQMLILTPAAPVAAVHPELPAFTSCSSLPTSAEVHNLSLHAQLPGALATANSVVLKPALQTQAPFSAASVSKTSVCAVKTNRMIQDADHPRPQTLNTSFPPVRTHSVDRKQSSCPPGQQMAHHQLILQQATAGALNHKHLHPIALKVAPYEPNCQPLSLSIKRLTTPSTQAQTNTDPPVSSAPASSTSSSSSSSPSVTPATISSAQTSIPAATVQSQPPPLVAAPKRQTSTLQTQNQPPPPPPPLVLHRLPPNPPASLQRFSLHSVHALAVQTGQRMRTEQELSIAETLNMMPYQNLPPPQTVAVDLKVHVVGRRESSSVTLGEFQAGQECKGKRQSPEETKEGSLMSQQMDKTPKIVSEPKQNGKEKQLASTPSIQSVIKIPQVERSVSLSTNLNHQPPPSSSPPLPTSAPPTAVRSPPQVTSAPTNLPGSPDRTSSVLTHLIEGFVIREGLEPFPVNSSSLSEEQQASLPEPQQVHTNGNPAAEDSPVDADLSESSDSEMETGDPPGEELGEEAEAEAALLQCEYCGSRGYAQTFLRSRRFCSMTCVRRFNVSCTKRVSRLRAGRWSSRPLGRRGRPPGRMNVAFLRRAQVSYPAVRRQQSSERDEELREAQEEEEEEEEEQEEEHPAPMKTRLQKMTEKEQVRDSERTMPETISISDEEDDDDLPSQWNVEQVFSYIYSLPGGAVVADEFRSQEIDGQALLLLTEDHLVSSMNLKLGPALKLCAQIQSLRDA